jgi:hypothetical protein
VAVEQWFTQPMMKELLTGAIGALLGAWGGAHAIRRIAERANRREMLRKEVLKTNAAIGQVHMLLNTFLNLKEQFFRPMQQRFVELEEIVHEIETARAAGRPARKSLPTIVPTELLYGIVWPRVDVGRLDRIISEELGVLGRPPALVAALVQDSAGLETLVNERSQLVDGLKISAAGGGLKREHFGLIFGLSNAVGGIDLTFKSNLHGIAGTNDACIHFCKLLNRDLYSHGARMRRRYLRQFRGPIPEISKANFGVAESKGLFPDPKSFTSWETNFITRPPVTEGRRLGKWWYAWRKAWRWVLLKPWGRWRKRAKYMRRLS